MKNKKRAFGAVGCVTVLLLVVIYFVVKAISFNIVRNEFEKNEAYTIEDKVEESDDINSIDKAVKQVHNDVIDTKNELRFREVISVLNSVFSIYWAEDGKFENLTGEKLANIVVNTINKKDVGTFGGVSQRNDTVITDKGAEFRFEINGGDCSNGGCYLIIDANGFDNSPNKLYEGGKPVYDRLRVPITRDELGTLKINDPLTELIYKDKQ